MNQTSAEIIKEKAIELGFTRCGIAQARPLSEEQQKFELIIREGRHAQMNYLSRESEKRFSPELFFPNCKSVIVCLYHYDANIKISSDYRIARYAYLQDYHLFIKEKLERLATFIHQEKGNYKITVDSSPISEKNWAVKAGLGSIGKNSLFRSKEGSFCFIGTILTDLSFDYDMENPVECGDCTRCIDACPTQAIIRPYCVDANRCISCRTIEEKNAIHPCDPDDLWIFGCDICQEVCPHNAKPFHNPDVENYFSLFLHFKNEDFEELDKEKFDFFFKGSSLERRKFENVKREIKRVERIINQNEINKDEQY